MTLPPDAAPVEANMLSHFAGRNFERSRRFGNGAYDPRILQNFLESRGNPQHEYRTIHVAGTVAKGSVTTMLARALTAMGFHTGQYVSPHFVSLKERIAINDVAISTAQLEALWHEMENLPELNQLSFFDAMTAMAFTHFARERCGIAVIETGLGGRLDSTNNLRAEMAVITPIGMDHMNILGDTLAAIASEKAGIIHTDQQVYTFGQHADALQVLRDRCTKVGAMLHVIDAGDDDFLTVNRAFVREVIRRHFAPDTGAFAAVEAALDRPIFGRWTILREGPRVIFDSGHNLPAIEALARLVNRQPESECNIFLNTMRERDLAGFSRYLKANVKKQCRLFFFPMTESTYYENPVGLLEAASPEDIRRAIQSPGVLNIFAGSTALYSVLRQEYAL